MSIQTIRRVCVMVLTAAALSLAGCGGGGGAGSSSNNPVESPEQAMARALAGPTVSRDASIPAPLPSEEATLYQQDAVAAGSVGGMLLPGRYATTIGVLVQRAGLNLQSMQVYVAADLSCGTGIAGGFAGYAQLVLDGKLLDVLGDVANYMALLRSGRATASLDAVMDTIVYAHAGRPCMANDPLVVPFSALSPAELSDADSIFYQLAGGIFFHEFGHLWSSDALTSLRANYVPGLAYMLMYYPTASEDRADVTSGILSAKSNHSLANAQLWLDVAPYLWLVQRGYPVLSYADKATTLAYVAQIDSTHSSPVVRQRTMARGFNAW
jgi:hypothetical protein